MEYYNLLLEQDYHMLKSILEFREVECTYFSSESNFCNNREIIAKTVYGHLINPDKIRMSLMKLSQKELEQLSVFIHSESIQQSLIEKYEKTGFFLLDEDRTPVFHDNFEEAIHEMHIAEEPEALREDTLSDCIAYSLYAIMANGFIMDRIRCLADMKPGLRMFECISSRINAPITPKFFNYYFEFLKTTGLIKYTENPVRMYMDGELVIREKFYKNWFKFIDSSMGVAWLEEVKAKFAARGESIQFKKQSYNIDKESFDLLVLSDFIKSLDDETFVLTDKAMDFLTSTHTIQAKEKSFFMLPGFKIMVPRDIDETILSTLIRFSHVEMFDNVYHLKIDIHSLIKARKKGMNNKSIFEFLETYGGTLQEDFKLMISDSFERFGEVKIFSRFTSIVADTPFLKEKVANIEELKKYIEYENGNCLIIDKSILPYHIKEHLISEGLIPEYTVGHNYKEIRREDVDKATEYLLKLAEEWSFQGNADYDDLLNLLDKLKIVVPDKIKLKKNDSQKQTVSSDSIGMSEGASVEVKVDLLQFAIAKKYRLKILYKQKGTEIMEQRIIQPKYLDGDFLVAFCEDRKADRRFNIYTLQLTQFLFC